MNTNLILESQLIKTLRSAKLKWTEIKLTIIIILLINHTIKQNIFSSIIYFRWLYYILNIRFLIWFEWVVSMIQINYCCFCYYLWVKSLRLGHLLIRQFIILLCFYKKLTRYLSVKLINLKLIQLLTFKYHQSIDDNIKSYKTKWHNNCINLIVVAIFLCKTSYLIHWKDICVPSQETEFMRFFCCSIDWTSRNYLYFILWTRVML